MTDEISKELVRCPGCNEMVHTKPTEGVPNQSLRTCDKCEKDFYLDEEMEHNG